MRSDTKMQKQVMTGKFENYRNRFFAVILVASMAWGGLTGCASDMGSTAEQPPPAADCPEGDLECMEHNLHVVRYY